MKFLVLPLALLSAVQFASAGIVIVEEADQTGGPAAGKTTLTITASGEHARIDMGKEVSTIVDSKAGTVTSLMHSQKMAMQIPEGALDAIKKQTTNAKSKPDLKPTGKKEVINGFNCEEYKGRFEGLDVSFWVTHEVKNQKEILDQLSKLSGMSDPFKGALQSGEDFPGFPIRTKIKSPQMGASTMTVISIKNEDVPDSAFEIPSDYKPMSIPKMSNPGGGAPAVPASDN